MFRSRRGGDRAGWSIKPDQYVDPDSITVAWDEVLRLIVTIKLKESTASDIFRRLNSYSRQHRDRANLWGFCVKKTRERHAVREMKEDPSEPSCRGRLQTAMSCFGQNPRW
jgi:hypothetical protein